MQEMTNKSFKKLCNFLKQYILGFKTIQNVSNLNKI